MARPSILATIADRALGQAPRGGRSRLAGGADIALALIVILVVALMIVPLPTFVLDILLATN